jgi:rhodanese-related sulfurtransferase
VNQFFNFVVNHWILWSIFVLVIIVILFEEIRGRVQGIPRVYPRELTNLINKQDAVVIDVRDPNAFARGHILGSINIPHTQMDTSIEKLEQYRGRPIVVVCANGQTSPQEGTKLRHKGFENVSFLSGGISAWKEDGLPLSKD